MNEPFGMTVDDNTVRKYGAADAASVPLREYQRRRAGFARKEEILSRADRQLSLLRAGLFVAGFALLALSISFSNVAPWWCLLPALAFAIAVVKHETVSRELESCRRGTAHHEQNLQRMEHRWHGVGAAGERYVDERHPYECDLDLFGKGSLFQLLCQARTRLGEDTLADWLRVAASPAAIDFRQRAINELRDTSICVSSWRCCRPKFTTSSIKTCCTNGRRNIRR